MVTGVVPVTTPPIPKSVCGSFFENNKRILCIIVFLGGSYVPCIGCVECIYMVSQHLAVVALIVALMPPLVTPSCSIMYTLMSL